MSYNLVLQRFNIWFVCYKLKHIINCDIWYLYTFKLLSNHFVLFCLCFTDCHCIVFYSHLFVLFSPICTFYKVNFPFLAMNIRFELFLYLPQQCWFQMFIDVCDLTHTHITSQCLFFIKMHNLSSYRLLTICLLWLNEVTNTQTHSCSTNTHKTNILIYLNIHTQIRIINIHKSHLFPD